MVLKYDYALATRFYYDTISDSYRITYLKWGGGALALLIVQIVLTRIARRKYRAKWGYYEKPTNKILKSPPPNKFKQNFDRVKFRIGFCAPIKFTHPLRREI